MIRKKSTICVLTILSLIILSISAQTSEDNDIWTPDKVVKKHDPFDLIASNFGQTAGTYNFNTDEWTIVPRANCSGCTAGGRHVVLKDLKLFVRDKEFWIKGMCYNPAPLGQKYVDMNSGFLTDDTKGGLCSIKETPWGEYRSACYDSDYFDSSKRAPDAPVPGPTNGWFYDAWMRDFPILKEMGVNTLRIYNTNPTTEQYSTEVVNGEKPNVFGIVKPYGKNHKLFMDLAYQNGFMVIFPITGDENLIKSTPKDKFDQFIRNQIDEIGNHPALLMWNVGNELNLDDMSLRQFIIEEMNYVKQYTWERWGRLIPVTHAIVDAEDKYDDLYRALPVDIFSTNAGYRGLSFSTLWNGNARMNFSGIARLANETGKPVFISEIGWHQVNGTETADPVNNGWFNQMYKDLLDHKYVGAVGGAYFEYSDEPLKTDVKQQTMGAVRFEIAQDGEVPADTITKTFPSYSADWPTESGSSSSPWTSTSMGTSIASSTSTNGGSSATTGGQTQQTRTSSTPSTTEVVIPTEEEGAATSVHVSLFLLVVSSIVMIL